MPPERDSIDLGASGFAPCLDNSLTGYRLALRVADVVAAIFVDREKPVPPYYGTHAILYLAINEQEYSFVLPKALG